MTQSFANKTYPFAEIEEETKSMTGRETHQNVRNSMVSHASSADSFYSAADSVDVIQRQ